MYPGFAATNVSESYDAKVFAVATLLSSYLIYNSVKVSPTITEASITYRMLFAVEREFQNRLYAAKGHVAHKPLI